MFRTSQTKDISLYVPIKIILKLALSNKNRSGLKMSANWGKTAPDFPPYCR
jgi:hypothetical protein